MVLGGAEVCLVDGGLEQGFVVEPVTGGCAQVGGDRSPRSGLDERLATPSPSTRRAMVAARCSLAWSSMSVRTSAMVAALRASARAATISSWAVRLPSWFAATLASRESRGHGSTSPGSTAPYDVEIAGFRAKTTSYGAIDGWRTQARARRRPRGRITPATGPIRGGDSSRHRIS